MMDEKRKSQTDTYNSRATKTSQLKLVARVIVKSKWETGAPDQKEALMGCSGLP